MNLYTKDHLLENKIVYFQPQQGYRSGIEPIILAAQANYNDKSILDLGSGCGPISLILAHRFPKAEIVGLENNTVHFELSQKSKKENKFNNEIINFKKDKNEIISALSKNNEYSAKSYVLTTGTFLNGSILIGHEKNEGGRINEKKSSGLELFFNSLNLKTGRLKWVCPPFPGVTPPTILVPYLIISSAWKEPNLPVKP